MLIKESNKEKIEKMIREAEGKATARTINLRNIIADIEKLERVLAIPKTRMVGVRANIDHHAQKYPHSYKYAPYSTQYTIERKKGGWDLISVERWQTGQSSKVYVVKLTEEAKAAILERMSRF